MFIDTYQGYFILLLFCVICVVGVLLLNKWNKSKLTRELKSNWGKEESRFRDFSLISAYHRSLPEGKYKSLDKKTSSDLNLNEFYLKLDRCKSKIGQQYLYSLLHSPVCDECILRERGLLIDLFSEDGNLRLKSQMEIVKLNRHLTYSIPNLIFDWELNPLKYKFLILFLSSLPILLILLGLYFESKFFLLIPISFLINLIIHYKNKPKLRFFMTPFVQIVALSEYAKKISDLGEELNRSNLKIAHQKFKNLKRYRFLLADEKHDQNEFSSFVSLILEYIKVTFLLEINLLDKCMKIAGSSRNEIHDLFRYVGLIDSCISIASYRAGLDSYCIPKFNQSVKMKTEGVTHPLIVDCVPNSIDTEGKNILITGSNMSGKTTFIRTVALNAILAQSIYTVSAKSYEACFLNVSTSIGISDSILQGKSYYLTELESIYSFIERSNELEIPNLFVMDELFKGTNTIERIAAGQAVLNYLGEGNNIILVSTHDLELSKLLHMNYELYYFTEDVSSQGLHFDHKLKKGVLKTRNAIKLLEYFHFPKEIIQSANTYIQSDQNYE